MSQSLAAKTCRFCSMDVAAMPRIKDKKGRYACRPCFERLRAKRGAIVAEPASSPTGSAFDPEIDTDSIMFALEESASTGQAPSTHCPTCKSLMSAGDVFCVHCGTNVQTGGRLGKVKVKRAKKSKAKKERGYQASRSDEAVVLFVSISIVAVSMLGAFMGIGEGSAGPLLLALGAIALAGYSLTVGIALLVSAFREGGILHFVLVLLVPLYGLYWAFFRASRLLRTSTILLMLSSLAFCTVFALLTLWTSEGWVEQGSISGIGNGR